MIIDNILLDKLTAQAKESPRLRMMKMLNAIGAEDVKEMIIRDK